MTVQCRGLSWLVGITYTWANGLTRLVCIDVLIVK